MEDQTRYLCILVAYVGKKPRERDLCDIHAVRGSDARITTLYLWKTYVTYILDTYILDMVAIVNYTFILREREREHDHPIRFAHL